MYGRSIQISAPLHTACTHPHNENTSGQVTQAGVPWSRWHVHCQSVFEQSQHITDKRDKISAVIWSMMFAIRCVHPRALSPPPARQIPKKEICVTRKSGW